MKCPYCGKKTDEKICPKCCAAIHVSKPEKTKEEAK